MFPVLFLQITDETSSLVVAQLLFLQSENGRTPVHMYINSPGTQLKAAVQEGVYCILGCFSFLFIYFILQCITKEIVSLNNRVGQCILIKECLHVLVKESSQVKSVVFTYL